MNQNNVPSGDDDDDILVDIDLAALVENVQANKNLGSQRSQSRRRRSNFNRNKNNSAPPPIVNRIQNAPKASPAQIKCTEFMKKILNETKEAEDAFTTQNVYDAINLNEAMSTQTIASLLEGTLNSICYARNLTVGDQINLNKANKDRLQVMRATLFTSENSVFFFDPRKGLTREYPQWFNSVTMAKKKNSNKGNRLRGSQRKRNRSHIVSIDGDEELSIDEDDDGDDEESGDDIVEDEDEQVSEEDEEEEEKEIEEVDDERTARIKADKKKIDDLLSKLRAMKIGSFYSRREETAEQENQRKKAVGRQTNEMLYTTLPTKFHELNTEFCSNLKNQMSGTLVSRAVNRFVFAFEVMQFEVYEQYVEELKDAIFNESICAGLIKWSRPRLKDIIKEKAMDEVENAFIKEPWKNLRQETRWMKKKILNGMILSCYMTMMHIISIWAMRFDDLYAMYLSTVN